MPKRLPFMMDDFRATEDEAQLDVLARATDPSDEGLDELGLQLLGMRDELCEAPDAQTRWNHLAAMRRAVPTARPRRTARGVAAVAAATVSVLALTAGLAAANQLPKSAQDRAARLAEIVGVDLPGNDHQSDPSHSTPSTTAPGSTTANDGRTPSTGSSGGDGSTVAPANQGTATSPAPGQSGSAPGQSGTAPGHSGSAPGQSGSTPGQSGSTPGQSGTGPDQTGTSPGKSGSAPGQSGTAPGKSGTAPGHAETAPTDPDTSPGKSGDAPGHNK
jgi:hypothetical protein